MNNNRQTQLSREFYCRNQSERILDKHLLKKDNVGINVLEKQIYGEKQKKVKQEDNTQNSTYIIKIDLNPIEAMNQVMKYLTNENKAQIALKKIQILIANYTEQFDCVHIIYILWNICNMDDNVQNQQQNLIIQIYKDVEAQNKVTFNSSMFKIIKILGIQMSLKNQLNVDDSYAFNDFVKQLSSEIQILKQIHTNQFDSITFEVEVKDYEQQFIDQFNTFEQRNQLRQKYLMNCLKILVKQYKNQWAKVIVHQFMMDINYNEKDIFDQEYQQQFDNLLQIMHNSKIIQQTNNSQQDKQNAKFMQDYLKPNHDVVDSRSTINASDGLDQWQLKQSGL